MSDTATETNILSIPNEILVMIGMYLNYSDLDYLSKTCSRIRNVYLDNKLMKISLQGGYIDVKDIQGRLYLGRSCIIPESLDQVERLYKMGLLQANILIDHQKLPEILTENTLMNAKDELQSLRSKNSRTKYLFGSHYSSHFDGSDKRFLLEFEKICIAFSNYTTINQSIKLHFNLDGGHQIMFVPEKTCTRSKDQIYMYTKKGSDSLYGSREVMEKFTSLSSKSIYLGIELERIGYETTMAASGDLGFVIAMAAFRKYQKKTEQIHIYDFLLLSDYIADIIWDNVEFKDNPMYHFSVLASKKFVSLNEKQGNIRINLDYDLGFNNIAYPPVSSPEENDIKQIRLSNCPFSFQDIVRHFNFVDAYLSKYFGYDPTTKEEKPDCPLSICLNGVHIDINMLQKSIKDPRKGYTSNKLAEIYNGISDVPCPSRLNQVLSNKIFHIIKKKMEGSFRKCDVRPIKY